jgi:hypothetical protein
MGRRDDGKGGLAHRERIRQEQQRGEASADCGFGSHRISAQQLTTQQLQSQLNGYGTAPESPCGPLMRRSRDPTE